MKGNTLHHTLVIPYYVPKGIEWGTTDLTRYHRLVKLMRELLKFKGDYVLDVLVVPRFDASIDDGLVKLCEEWLPKCQFPSAGMTSTFQTTTPISGYPKGANAMFYDVANYFAKRMPTTKGFWLWYESDMCFTCPDAIDQLDKAWRLLDKPKTMGTYQGNIIACPPHINGGACYSYDLGLSIDPKKVKMEVAFDVDIYKFVKDHCYDTPLIELNLQALTYNKPHNPKCVLYHGVKDASFVHEIYNRFGLAWEKS